MSAKMGHVDADVDQAADLPATGGPTLDAVGVDQLVTALRRIAVGWFVTLFTGPFVVVGAFWIYAGLVALPLARVGVAAACRTRRSLLRHILITTPFLIPLGFLQVAPNTNDMIPVSPAVALLVYLVPVSLAGVLWAQVKYCTLMEQLTETVGQLDLQRRWQTARRQLIAVGVCAAAGAISVVALGAIQSPTKVDMWGTEVAASVYGLRIEASTGGQIAAIGSGVLQLVAVVVLFRAARATTCWAEQMRAQQPA